MPRGDTQSCCHCWRTTGGTKQEEKANQDGVNDDDNMYRENYFDIHFGIFALPHLYLIFVHIVKEQGNEVCILKQVYSTKGH